MQSREVPPASLAGGLPKKTTEVGIRACDVHIRAELPIPCLFSFEKLPCEEKHSFYYLWGQPLLFIMLMLLCYMPSTSPLFHREVFLCTEWGKKEKKKTPPCLQCSWANYRQGRERRSFYRAVILLRKAVGTEHCSAPHHRALRD